MKSSVFIVKTKKMRKHAKSSNVFIQISVPQLCSNFTGKHPCGSVIPQGLYEEHLF